MTEQQTSESARRVVSCGRFPTCFILRSHQLIQKRADDRMIS